MHLRLLAALLLFLIQVPVFAAFQRSQAQLLRDSLVRVMPHESPEDQAEICLIAAQRLRYVMPDEAYNYLLLALRYSLMARNDSLRAETRLIMGDFLLFQRRFIEAQKCYLSARTTFSSIHDTTGEIRSLANIGNISRILQNYNTAIEYLQDGIRLARLRHDKNMEARLLGHEALTFQNMGDRESAEFIFHKSIDLFRETGNRSDELMTRDNLASLYMDQNQDSVALGMYNEILKEADTGFLMQRGILCTRIGHISYKKHDYRTSLAWNLKALELRRKDHSVIGVNSSLINVGGDYLSLGMYDSAVIYLDSGMAMAQRSDRKDYLRNAYQHYYEYYQRTGNYKKALDYYARYSEINRQLLQEQLGSNIRILEAGQRLEQTRYAGARSRKDNDLQELTKGLSQSQTRIMLILVLLAAASMFYFVLWYFNIRRVRLQMQEFNVRLTGEIREREAAQEKIRDRENQFKFITDHSEDFITLFDQENRRIYASPSAMRIYGYTEEEMLAKIPDDLIHPDFINYTKVEAEELVRSRTSRQLVYQSLRKGGSTFWAETILNPLFDPATGAYKGALGVTRDIQVRKTKEIEIMEGTKQKENLMKEIHHRVKNNFAILVSLINMQLAQTKNPELTRSLINLQLRIRTMALVHEMLYRSGDFEKISFPGYLHSLASVIAGTFNQRQVELSIHSEEVFMDIETLIPLGLIINELLSNAYKHAFPERQNGKISITFSTNPETGENTLLLKDDGIGLPEGLRPDQCKSMGLQVVHILSTQIEGKLEVANNPGASFTITFRPNPNRKG